MKKYNALTGMILVLSLTVVSCMEKSKPIAEMAKPAMDTVTLIKHGEYLVTVMGCHDCHSPKKMGGNHLRRTSPLIRLA